MEKKFITEKDLEAFRRHLRKEEKSENTMRKYMHDVNVFYRFSCGAVNRETVIAYKQSLIDKGYAVRSINSMLAALNSMLTFLGRPELRVKAMKLQQRVFRPEERELTVAEDKILCRAA